MFNSAFNIQTYFPEGDTTGIRHSKIEGLLGSVIVIPRNKLKLAVNYRDFIEVGVYFLVGGDNQEDTYQERKKGVYIGEAENCFERIKQHNNDSSKDFWNVALVFSKVDNLTRTDIKYLEWISFKQIDEANRYNIKNNNVPNKPRNIEESKEATLSRYFNSIKILVSFLGFPLFSTLSKPNEISDIFICKKGNNIIAKGQYTEEGFVVLKGSQATSKTRPSILPYSLNRLQQLIDEGILKEDGEILVFQEDCIFNSPSGAAGIIRGGEENGWISWKRESDGKTLDEVIRRD